MWILLGGLFFFFCQVVFFYVWQKKLWTWHCKNVYPFHEKLTPKEQEYIERCMRLSWGELLRPFLVYCDPLLVRLSFFSYSHRVKGERVSSGRVAYGSAIFPQTAYEYAKEVLAERGVVLPIENHVIFGGLGWDLEEGTFRVYMRCKKLELLPRSKKTGEGGVAWTFDAQGKKIEEKIYSFPAKKTTQLDSSQRGVIYQYDDTPSDLPEKAQEMIRFYQNHGYELDTYTKQDNVCTLYFPKIP